MSVNASRAHRSLSCIAIVVLWAVATSTRLAAQSDPGDEARFRFGDLAMTPAVIFVAGHDTNVYREQTGFADYEMFVVPQVAAWWTRPGFRVSALGVFETVSFANNVGAQNSRSVVKIERLHSLFAPYFSYSRNRTNANVTGFEVGYKSLRLLNDYAAGATIDISPRTRVTATGRLMRTNWDADARYQTSVLRESLNRDTYSADASLSYAVTPLTSLHTRVSMSEDRFTFSPVRNGTTQQVSGGVEFGKAAWLRGAAQVGFEHFTSPASGAADFNGLTAAINVGWASPEGTSLMFAIDRETSYSFDTSLAYFVATGRNVTGGRRFGERWEGVGFLGQYDLDYRPAGTVASVGRVDTVTEYGGAMAYRLRRDMRVGWSMQHLAKVGPGPFSAFQLAMFWTYGTGKLQQISCLPATELDGAGRACR